MIRLIIVISLLLLAVIACATIEIEQNDHEDAPDSVNMFYEV